MRSIKIRVPHRAVIESAETDLIPYILRQLIERVGDTCTYEGFVVAENARLRGRRAGIDSKDSVPGHMRNRRHCAGANFHTPADKDFSL